MVVGSLLAVLMGSSLDVLAASSWFGGVALLVDWLIEKKEM